MTVEDNSVFTVAGSTYIGRTSSSTPVLGGNGKFVQTGGTSNLNNRVYLASISGAVCNGTIEVSGGSLNITAAVALDARTRDEGGSSVIHVIGNAGTITINGGASGSPNSRSLCANSGTVFKFTILDADDGVSVIDTAGIGNYSVGNVVEGTVDMVLDTGVTPAYGQEYTLIQTPTTSPLNIDNLNLAAEDVGVWLLDNTESGKLKAIYNVVPEPATMSVLGLGLVLAGLRRRRQAA